MRGSDRRFAYHLAKELGVLDVDRVFALPMRRFREWQAFSQLEPFGEERADQRTAAIEAALWNIHRDPKRHPKGWPLSEFFLGLGDMPSRTIQAAVPQTVATQEFLIDAWIGGSNAVFVAKQNREKRGS